MTTIIPVGLSYGSQLSLEQKQKKKSRIDELIQKLKAQVKDFEYFVYGRSFKACKELVAELEVEVASIKNVKGCKTLAGSGEKALRSFENELYHFIENELALEDHDQGEVQFALDGVKWLQERGQRLEAQHRVLTQLIQSRAVSTANQLTNRKLLPKADSQDTGAVSRLASAGSAKLTKKEKEGCSLIEKINNAPKEKRPSILTKAERQKVLKFLKSAIGNRELYRKLKKLHAETSVIMRIRDLAFLTSDDKRPIRKEIEKFQNAIESTNLHQISDAEYTICDPKEGYEVELFSYEGKNKGLKKAIDAFKAALEAIPPRNRFEWRLGDECRKLLCDILGQAANSDIKPIVEGYLLQTQRVKEIIQGYEADAKRSDYTPPLDFDTVRRAHSFQRLDDFFGTVILPACPDVKDDSELNSICNSAKQCEEAWYTLLIASSLLPLAQSGDVLLHDERKVKALNTSKGPVYSDLSWRKNPLLPFKILWEVLNSSLFSVQPYFTGARIHAAGVFYDQNRVNKYHTIEVEGLFQTPSLDPRRPAQSVMYRFDAAKMIGDQKLNELAGKLKKSPKQAAAWLNELYRQEYDDVALGVKKAGDLLQNCQFRASLSYLKSLARKHLPEPLRKAAVFGASILLGENGLIERIEKFLLTLKGVVPAEKIERKFCSELIAEIMKNTIEKVNAKVQNVAGMTECLPQLIDIPPGEIYPNLLEEKIKNHFELVQEPPLLSKILLGDSEGSGVKTTTATT